MSLNQSQRNRKSALLNHNLNNEISKKDHCEICKIKFMAFVKTPHLCKRCYRTVCSDCGSREQIPGCLEKDDSAHRLCKVCKTDIEFQKELMSKYQLKWAKDSIICKNWLKHVGLLEKIQDLKEEYNQIQDKFQSYMQNPLSDNEDYKQLIIDLGAEKGKKESFNFSLFDLIQSLQYSNQNNTQVEIKNILKAFIFKYPYVGYGSQMISVVSFLLCFCSEASAFGILSEIYNQIIPNPLYYKNLEEELDTTTIDTYIEEQVQNLSSIMSIQPNNQGYFRDFLKQMYLNYYQSLFINFFTVQVSFNLMEFMLRYKDFVEIEKMMQIIMQVNFQTIVENNQNIDVINELILKYTNINQINVQRASNREFQQKYQNVVQFQSKQDIQPQKPQKKEIQKPVQKIQKPVNDSKEEKEEKEKLQEKIAILNSEIDQLKQTIMTKDEKILDMEVINESIQSELENYQKNQQYQQKNETFLLEELARERDKMEDDLFSQYNSVEKIKIKIKTDELHIKKLQEQQEKYKKSAKDYYDKVQDQNQRFEQFTRQIQDLKKEVIQIKTENLKLQQENNRHIKNEKVLKQQQQNNSSSKDLEQQIEQNQKQQQDETKQMLDFIQSIGGRLQKVNNNVKTDKQTLDQLLKQNISNEQKINSLQQIDPAQPIVGATINNTNINQDKNQNLIKKPMHQQSPSLQQLPSQNNQNTNMMHQQQPQVSQLKQNYNHQHQPQQQQMNHVRNAQSMNVITQNNNSNYQISNNNNINNINDHHLNVQQQHQQQFMNSSNQSNNNNNANIQQQPNYMQNPNNNNNQNLGQNQRTNHNTNMIQNNNNNGVNNFQNTSNNKQKQAQFDDFL